MKRVLVIVLLVFSFLFIGCGQNQRINATSTNAMLRSVGGILRHLPENERVAFQVSFWSLKQYADSDVSFRKSVHGKTVAEIVEMGKENYKIQAGAGNPEYIKFDSWEEMIVALIAERKESELRAPRQTAADGDNQIHRM